MSERSEGQQERKSGEGSLEAPTRHPIRWNQPGFYDEAARNAELTRVFHVWHGCRRCVSLCNAPIPSQIRDALLADLDRPYPVRLLGVRRP